LNVSKRGGLFRRGRVRSVIASKKKNHSESSMNLANQVLIPVPAAAAKQTPPIGNRETPPSRTGNIPVTYALSVTGRHVATS